MFTLIHGEDTNKSLTFLQQLIKDHVNWQIIRCDLKVEAVDFNQLFLTDTLFAENKLVVLENFSKSKKKLDFKNLKHSPKTKIILFENSQLSTGQLAKLPQNTKFFLFKPEPVIFQLFDQLYPGNRTNVFKIFAKVQKEVDPYFFFALLIRHLRLLLIARNGAKIKLPLADWQIKKYQNFSEKFTKERLIAAYGALLKIDTKLKTGEISSPFAPLSLLLLELTKG